MNATEQQLYELLARTDHPVFKRDLSSVTDGSSPFNSIQNRLIAKQLKRLADLIDEIQLNAFPHTATALGIDQWEETYFGFTKDGIDLATRIELLLERFNSRPTMSEPDALTSAIAITGVTPTIQRRLSDGGWVLGVGALGVDTILADPSLAVNQQTYLVVFTDAVDSDLIRKLDKELTKIQKGGSIHIIITPSTFWTLGLGALGVDTVLG